MLLSNYANYVQFLIWAKIQSMMLWQKGNYLCRFPKDSASLRPRQLLTSVIPQPRVSSFGCINLRLFLFLCDPSPGSLIFFFSLSENIEPIPGGVWEEGKSKWKKPSTEDHSLLFSHMKYTQCRDRKWINGCLGVGQSGLGGSRNRKWLFIAWAFFLMW